MTQVIDSARVLGIYTRLYFQYNDTMMKLIKSVERLGQWIEDNSIPLFLGMIFGITIVLLRMS